MTYACGTNVIIENDEQVSQVIDELSHGDGHQKGNDGQKWQ